MSLWLDRVPRARRPSYPTFRGEESAEVAIVGGGITGCACAASFAAAGVSVILLEADRIGAASTAGSVGLVREDFDASFQDTASTHGLRAARMLWSSMRRASLDFAAALRRSRIRCDLVPQDALRFVRRDPIAAKVLRREYEARRAAGLDHTWLNAGALLRETAIEGGGAIRTRGFAVDPYRACIGFAAAAAGRGAALFQQSPVTRIRSSRKGVDVVTARGVVHADTVLIATSAPLPDLRPLRRHLHPTHAYVVVTEPLPAAVRRELGRRAAALRDDAEPPHVLRWLKDDRVMFAGGDQAPVAARAQAKTLVQRSGQLMYELSMLYPAISGARPESTWSASYDATVDGLPYIGTHRNFPRHLFALGHARHGLGLAWLAARVLLRQYQGAPDRGDDLLGFSRILK